MTDSAIVASTLEAPPEPLGVTHWSSRLLGKELGIWRCHRGPGVAAYGVQPWRRGTFKFSTDPELVAKVNDVVGLYLDPPEKGVVICSKGISDARH